MANGFSPGYLALRRENVIAEEHDGRCCSPHDIWEAARERCWDYIRWSQAVSQVSMKLWINLMIKLEPL